MARPLVHDLGLVGLAALLLASLASCSGTPLGDRLSGSFGAPVTPAAAPGSANDTRSDAGAGKTAAPPPSPSPTSPAGTAGASGSAKPGAAAATKPTKPAKPVASLQGAGSAPRSPASSAAYRITIKLPGADPSAPAELVTEALRAAGVSFEVETIERMPSEGGRATAPAGANAAAPASSPAPAPR
jgi:hypothetical protein